MWFIAILFYHSVQYSKQTVDYFSAVASNYLSTEKRTPLSKKLFLKDHFHENNNGK